MKMIRNYFNNFNLKKKMILSYAVVGILPFLVFSFFVINLTNQQLQESARHNFETIFYNSGTIIQKKIENIEYSMNMIASISDVAETINAQYFSGYERYYNIKYGFDPVVDAFAVTNPELSHINFYVNDTYAGVRTNFIPLQELDDVGILDKLKQKEGVQWFFDGRNFYAYVKIYCPSNVRMFSVMEIKIPEKVLVDPQILQELNYQLSLRGDVVIAGFSYEVFSREEYAEFLKCYQTCDLQWAKEDFDKIGMEKAISHYQEYLPEVTSVWHKDNTLVIRMKLPEEAIVLYGGMRELETVICLEEKQILVDFAWWGKEATRVAEGSWIAFCPSEKVTGIQKLGSMINPGQVVRHGNRRLHATDGEVAFETLALCPLDSPIVSVGEKGLLKFPETAAELDRGVFCNLHNNIWGTNSPMWYLDDARFRFVVRL